MNAIILGDIIFNTDEIKYIHKGSNGTIFVHFKDGTSQDAFGADQDEFDKVASLLRKACDK